MKIVTPSICAFPRSLWNSMYARISVGYLLMVIYILKIQRKQLLGQVMELRERSFNLDEKIAVQGAFVASDGGSKILIQLNGRSRSSGDIQKWLQSNKVEEVVVIPGKLVNIITK